MSVKMSELSFKILPGMLPIGEAFFTFSSRSFADTLSFVTKLKAKLLDGFVFADISFILGCELYYLDVSCIQT